MARNARRAKTGECALCGATGEMTREHVPPQCLFLKPRPQNTITVSLCQSCNHSYHLDDEYFRVLVGASPQPSKAQLALWDEKVIRSSFLRSRGLKIRLTQDADFVQRYALHDTMEFQDGTPLPRDMVPFLIAFDRARISRVVDKIVRCLYFHHQKHRLRGQVSVEMMCPEDSVLDATITQPSGRVGLANEFLYRFVEKCHGHTMWYLIFYGCHVFTVDVFATEEVES
jgi:hypothetical protein